MKIFTIIIFFTLLPVAVLADGLPTGYRYPTSTDMTGDWKLYEKDIPRPYFAEADFDGNGITDQAWILFKNKGEDWGLFVFLGQKNEKAKVLKLDDSNGALAQHMGIVLLDPGKHKTACGKGYWDCEKDEPAVLDLNLPAIDYFTYESANSVFYWNEPASSFQRVWMSD